MSENPWRDGCIILFYYLGLSYYWFYSGFKL